MAGGSDGIYLERQADERIRKKMTRLREAAVDLAIMVTEEHPRVA